MRSAAKPLERLLGPKTTTLSLSPAPSPLPLLSPWPPTEPHSQPKLPPDPQTYANFLISLSKQSLLSQFRHPFDEIPHRARVSKDCKTLHARILKLGFQLSGRLGNALVDLYSKSGDLVYSQKAFDQLEKRDRPAWNSILSAHSRQGSTEEVIRAFRSMRCFGAPPDQFGFAIVLSACAQLAALNCGRQIHCEVIKSGFESDSFCEGSLIDMYSKCNHVADARRVFDGITNPDTISWTNMIAGYVRTGMFDEALRLFSRMEGSGGTPDQVTYVTAITACVSLGRLEDARALFMQMPLPNAVAWNAIISGHAQNGHETEALGFFKEMRSRGVKPTRSTLGSVLSAAANLMALGDGRQVHSEAIRLGLDTNVFVGSSLINLYAKCGRIQDARKVFNFSDERNLVMWNAMLGGHVQNGQPQEVIDLFSAMKGLGFKPDEFTFVSIFNACACLEDIYLGKQLHSVVIKSNLEVSLFTVNAVVDMYAKCGELNDAKKQFELISSRDAVSWNAMMVGLVHNKHEEEALSTFQRMRLDLLAPDEVSLATVISACTDLQAFEEGKQMHCLSIKSDLSKNVYAGSSLIDLYAKLGEVIAAKKVFLQMPEKSVVSWNALIAGFVQNNNEEAALDLFRQLQIEGLEPSQFTFASILPACSGPSRITMGQQVHCHTLKSGLLFNDTFLGVSLLGMYLKSRMLDDANKLFLDMPDNNSLVLWTAIISGHAQNGHNDDALLLFRKMRSYNIQSDEATFASVLGACADLAALGDGREIHSLIIKTGYNSYEYVSSALIDMYSKCGHVSASLQVFKELEGKEDIISWNSMIVGLAKNGYADEALNLFQAMEESQIKPDDITFLGILTACSHAGLVSEGRGFFDSMTMKYGITPRVDHYACLIDILGRGGSLKEAEELIDRLPFEPDGVIWATLLAACRMHGDGIRGKRAAEKLMELEPHNSSPYVLLSSIYAASGNWASAKEVREAMKERGVRKSPGCSWITVGSKTSLFIAGDKFHPDSVDIYETLVDLTVLMKEDGYVAEPDLLVLDEEFG
ncbi:pentatricopeptide repeat-containing protein At3g09040, mitochondrial [Phoenix dactylifera]|uniref:Pentatricopeptide repeat-containing protein At3g09040, mitochondrial n=1 Tax=Phoenix dactylifera TaxID=42345 RepID=A0A8B7BTU8_PHODC|nr:pentatricopeptide repeat-containing protein At3g09040, mitochondrial [Phoenix dactylifera]XP_008785201.1 pentatricopeptide repeat-containing protein At3g09040, mitochondrial [Phoenix dactylifera]